MARVLKITDGSSEVELVDGSGNVLHIKRWRPKVAAYKDNGQFRSSPLTDGRRLVAKPFENPIEEMAFNIDGAADQDGAEEAVQDLIRLLEKATDYWTDEAQNTPVYLERKAKNETNTAYAIIHSYRIPDHDDIFDILFSEQNQMNDVPLFIERGHWRSSAPTSLDALPISTVESYGFRALGTVDADRDREARTDDLVFVANKFVTANLLHVWIDKAATGFGPNLLDSASVPINLDISDTADALYIGIDNTTDAGPFDNVVFVLERGSTLSNSFVWEYWDGGAWGTLTVQDNTDDGTVPLSQSGSVHWDVPSDLAVTTVNSVSAYWVRLRTLTPGGVGAFPRLVHKGGVYTAGWNYVEAASDDIGGDIDAAIEAVITGRSYYDSSPEHGVARGVFVGARGYDRGATFRAFVNIADEQNTSGIALSAVHGDASFTTDVTAPTGRKMRLSPSGAINDAILFTALFNTSAAADYTGRFRAFLICNRTGATTNFTDLQLLARNEDNADTLFASDRRDATSQAVGAYLDFGQVTLPNQAHTVAIRGSADGTTDDLDFYALVLMPVDEWSGHYLTTLSQDSAGILRHSTLSESTYLQVTAVHGTIDKGVRRAQLRQQGGTDNPLLKWQSRGRATPRLKANRRQRLHFFFQADAENGIAAPFDFATSVKLLSSQQYLSGRGSR